MAKRRGGTGDDVRAVVPLDGAVRQDGSGKGGAGSGIQPDGSWVPAFPGQRPPLRPGHEASVTSGAYSPRRVGPLAARIREELLAGEDCPGWLHEERFAAGLAAWSEAEAMVVLIREWLDTQDLDEALSEITTADEDETRPAPGGMRRTVRQRRRTPALEALAKWMTRAQSLRNDLGLTPKAYAAMARDVSLTRRAQEDAIERLGTAGAQIRAGRRALVAAEQAGDSSTA